MNRLIATVAGLLASSVAAASDSIYYADLFVPEFENGFIQRTNTEGVDPVTIVDTGYGLRSIQVDEESGKIFWCDAQLGTISRANLNGSSPEVIVGDLPFPAVIRIDPVNRKLYWGDQVSYEIRRANLDGTENELVTPTNFHRGLAIDNRESKIYWSTSIDMFRGEIKRCNFDGSKVETVVTTQLNQFKPSTIALDAARRRIYWTDYVVDVVQSASLDGGNIETLFAAPGNYNPEGIALDRSGQKVYWGQSVEDEGHHGEIRRMDFDGAHQEVVLAGTGQVNDLVLTTAAEPPCYADYDGDGVLDLFDFLAFVNSFNAGEDRANCDSQGGLDLFDFLCFVNAFNAGC